MLKKERRIKMEENKRKGRARGVEEYAKGR